VRHAGEVSGDDAAVDIFAQGQCELRLGANELGIIFSRSQMISRSRFGTWMPTVDLPAMRSIRMLSA